MDPIHAPVQYLDKFGRDICIDIYKLHPPPLKLCRKERCLKDHQFKSLMLAKSHFHALLPETPPSIKLSFFDCMFACVPPIQRLMLFSNPNTDLTLSSLVQILKSSLSATLLDYLPLAGKLTYLQSTGDIEIDLSAPAFSFVEAKSDLDLHQLATNEVHDVGSFLMLVPHIDVSVLPFPVFAVQVTRFGCGGLAISYAVQHTVVDGKALLQFVKAWTRACKAKFDGTETLAEGSKPLYRGVIKHPKGEEIARRFLRQGVPALPVANLLALEEERLHLMRRTFVLDAPSIQSLRERATTSQFRPSSFSVILAHVGACIAKSKSIKPDVEAIFNFLMDCRARLNPPIDEADYFGNCVRTVLVRILVSELTGKDGLINACTAIRKSIDRVSKDPLSDCENWLSEFLVIPSERLVNATASPRFQVYEADFGWGRPDRYESTSMNFAGEFALVAGREEGTVQVSVSLDPNQMEVFAECFSEVNGLT